MTDAIPAATLVLFRAAPDGGPDEHLFVERAMTMAFAGGAIVFPGGRVDAGDHALAAKFAGYDPDDAAARVAAIRETVEEAGVAIGIGGADDAVTVVKLRAHLHDGVPFGDALAGLNLSIDIAPLIPFARWRPNFRETRNFDTRFYLARAAIDAPAATVDETENVRLFWASARHALDETEGGRVTMIFPTRRNVERLATLGHFERAAAQAGTISIETITPWIEERGDQRYLCIPDGQGYPVTAERLQAAIRGGS
jgi:8-oxo-dGTP pyrophosphatase MutT (NUDIX family)